MGSKYWVGGGSSTNWNATGNTNWSDTDGGPNNADLPVAGDDVYLKSSANCARNVNTPALNSFDMLGYTGTLSGSATLIVAPASGTTVCRFASTGGNTSNGPIRFNPATGATVNLYPGGRALGTMTIQYDRSQTGIVSLQGALTSINRVLTILKGGFVSNGYSISLYRIYVESGSLDIAGSTVLLGTSGWTFTAGTLDTTNSHITCPGDFIGGNQTYNEVTITEGGWTFSGNNTFNILNLNIANNWPSLVVEDGTITTIVTNMTVDSYTDVLIAVFPNGYTTQEPAHFTTLAELISLDYVSLTNCVADEEDTWYAGTHSVDNGGNTNWLFSSPPGGTVYENPADIATSVSSVTDVQGYLEALATTVASLDSITDVQSYLEDCLTTVTSEAAATDRAARIETIADQATSVASVTDVVAVLETVSDTVTSIAAATDLAARIEQILDYAESADSVADIQTYTHAVADQATSVAVVDAVQAYLETLQTTITSTAAAVDTGSYVETVSDQATSAASVTDVAHILETVVTVAASTDQVADIVSYLESISDYAASVSTVADLAHYVDVAVTIATSTASALDVRHLYELITDAAGSLSSASDRQYFLDNVTVLVTSHSNVTEILSYLETVETVGITSATVAEFMGRYLRSASVPPRSRAAAAAPRPFLASVPTRTFSATVRPL